MVAGSTAGVHGRSVRERRVAWIQTSLQLGLILGRGPPRVAAGAQTSGPDRRNDRDGRQLPRGNGPSVEQGAAQRAGTTVRPMNTHRGHNAVQKRSSTLRALVA